MSSWVKGEFSGSAEGVPLSLKRSFERFFQKKCRFLRFSDLNARPASVLQLFLVPILPVCRIGDTGSLHLGPGSEDMGVSAAGTHDVLHGNPAHQQGISNQGAMAAPGDG